MHRLDGKVALVTGAGSGIGRGITKVIAEEGARVAALSRTEEHVRETVRIIDEMGGEALALKADVRNRVQVEAAVASALDAYGQIDVLVNNAGVNKCARFLDFEDEDWDRIFDVNVKGVYLVSQVVLEQMVAQQQGSIVNVASWVGRDPKPLFVPYSASKAAVISLTRGLALEVAEYNVRVNAVLPGNVWSGIWPQVLADYGDATGQPEEESLDEFVESMPFKRMQTVEDIAAAVVFLCTEEAREITGEALGVSGGL